MRICFRESLPTLRGMLSSFPQLSPTPFPDRTQPWKSTGHMLGGKGSTFWMVPVWTILSNTHYVSKAPWAQTCNLWIPRPPQLVIKMGSKKKKDGVTLSVKCILCGPLPLLHSAGTISSWIVLSFLKDPRGPLRALRQVLLPSVLAATLLLSSTKKPSWKSRCSPPRKHGKQPFTASRAT